MLVVYLQPGPRAKFECPVGPPPITGIEKVVQRFVQHGAECLLLATGPTMLRRLLPQTLTRALYSTKAFPQPTPQVPDVKAFLTAIGRNCIEHEAHFPEWESLFQSSGRDLKEKGIDVQKRRYILRQVEALRQCNEVVETKPGKKSYYGGERKRKERVAKLEAVKRQERYAHEDATV